MATLWLPEGVIAFPIWRTPAIGAEAMFNSMFIEGVGAKVVFGRE